MRFNIRHLLVLTLLFGLLFSVAGRVSCTHTRSVSPSIQPTNIPLTNSPNVDVVDAPPPGLPELGSDLLKRYRELGKKNNEPETQIIQPPIDE